MNGKNTLIKKLNKQFVLTLSILFIVLLLPINAKAEGNAELEDCECALPVELYLTYNGEERLLRSNYGILVGGSDEEGYAWLIASANNVQATPEEYQSMYDDYTIEEDDRNDVHAVIKVTIEKDIKIEATIGNVSNSLNLAVLKLSSTVFDHKGITFDIDEGCVTAAQEVYIPDIEGGFHTGYALNENTINGIKYVQFDSPMDWEQDGLPLYDADGEVLGMIQNSIDGIHKNALSSKEIVVVLKTLGVVNSVADHTIVEVDKKSLISATDVADKLDLSLYSEETASVMAEKIQEARSIIINEEVTQEEVDAAQSALLEAQEALVLKEGLGTMTIVFMIVSGVLLLAIFVIVLVLIIKKKKKKKKEAQEAELEAKKAPTNVGPYNPKKNNGPTGNNVSFAPGAMAYTSQSTIFSPQKSAPLASASGEINEGSKSVKLSNLDGFAPSSKAISFNEEDTTVLSVIEEEINDNKTFLGYLIRKSDGSRIDLKKNPSIIGKSDKKADYIIDEKAVSRAHLMIESKEGLVYVKDMSSLNGSKLNREKLNPEEEKELKDGDEITIADVELVYHK